VNFLCTDSISFTRLTWYGDHTHDAYSIIGKTYTLKARKGVKTSRDTKHLCIRLDLTIARANNIYIYIYIYIYGTVADNYFWSAAATIKNGLNRLGQPQTMEKIPVRTGTAPKHHFRSTEPAVEYVACRGGH